MIDVGVIESDEDYDVIVDEIGVEASVKENDIDIEAQGPSHLEEVDIEAANCFSPGDDDDDDKQLQVMKTLLDIGASETFEKVQACESAPMSVIKCFAMPYFDRIIMEFIYYR